MWGWGHVETEVAWFSKKKIIEYNYSLNIVGFFLQVVC